MELPLQQLSRGLVEMEVMGVMEVMEVMGAMEVVEVMVAMEGTST